jgi:SAM-dependent methyltransferase
MDQAEIWDDLVGDAWVQFADMLHIHSAPFGVAALDALGALDGATALDVGCGTGATTLLLADRVGPTGRVTGIDLSERMIERARSDATDVAHVSFIAGDVLELRPDAPVDAIYSRFGVMFFERPVDAFAHLRSLAGPGGRLAFSAWQDPFSNPWMLEPVLASAAVLGPPELPPPGAPGPFSLASTDVINTTLHEAGWAGIEITALSIEQPFGAGNAHETAIMVTGSNPVIAAGLQKMPGRRAEVVDVIAAALVPHERDGRIVLQAAASIVTATS